MTALAERFDDDPQVFANHPRVHYLPEGGGFYVQHGFDDVTYVLPVVESGCWMLSTHRTLAELHARGGFGSVSGFDTADDAIAVVLGQPQPNTQAA